MPKPPLSIKACPFCGSPGVVSVRYKFGLAWYFVKCPGDSCHIRPKAENGWQDKSAAIRAWNERKKKWTWFFVSLISTVVVVFALFFHISTHSLGGTYVAEDAILDASELDILSDDAFATTFTDNADDLIFTFEPSTEMVFTPDGHVEINGVPIKELDYPEIRDSIKQIADAMVSDRSVVQMCERQTEHLLSELEKCRKRAVVCP